jgi:hypothetical protein
MAKKSKATTALQFFFDAAQLRAILENNPDRLLFSVRIEPAVTKEGKKVGALAVEANGIRKGKMIRLRDGGNFGCPIPPCRWPEE